MNLDAKRHDVVRQGRTLASSGSHELQADGSRARIADDSIGRIRRLRVGIGLWLARTVADSGVDCRPAEPGDT